MLLCITMQKKLSICLYTKDNTLKEMFMHNNNNNKNNNAFGCSVYYSNIVNSSSSVSIFVVSPIALIFANILFLFSYILIEYGVLQISKSPNVNYLVTAVVTLLHLQRMVQFFVYTHVAEKRIII